MSFGGKLQISGADSVQRDEPRPLSINNLLNARSAWSSTPKAIRLAPAPFPNLRSSTGARPSCNSIRRTKNFPIRTATVHKCKSFLVSPLSFFPEAAFSQGDHSDSMSRVSDSFPAGTAMVLATVLISHPTTTSLVRQGDSLWEANRGGGVFPPFP